MAVIDSLLQQVSDVSLRRRLEDEFARVSKNKKFGLVFEEHIPECTPLYDVPVKLGSLVTLKNGQIQNLYIVTQLDGDQALCSNKITGEMASFLINDLVTVANFGEPIFPTLQPLDSIENAPSSDLWHSIIEADNYHALQLLEYLYPKKVDCIYIDPPYNTGAKDWKYNNNYVDASDAWRHSKWLSMMKKRLILAKRILADNGVLITTIDDNEYAHLWVLLHEIFPDLDHQCITIQHNPGGTQGKKFSVTNEYAIFSYSPESAIFRKPHLGGDVYNLRRWGSTSGRYEGATCFYPVCLNQELEITGFGDVLDDTLHPTGQTEINDDGTFRVWPIDTNGVEKKWRYARNTVETVRDRMFVEKRGDRLEIILRREDEPPKTIWTDPLFNAEAHGTEMLKTVFGVEFEFPFPKSLYAVKEALMFAVRGKKNALIVDFFAGSATTLHAVNLLNQEDNGNRRCILVTNNEVSESEATKLTASGFKPGDPDWERHGICRSITWPRTTNSILGRDSRNQPLTGSYSLGKYIQKESPRTYRQLGFIDDVSKLNITVKKQLVALFGTQNLPQSLVKADSQYIVSDKHPVSILFNEEMGDEWIASLENKNHISTFYIVTSKNRIFRNLVAKIKDLLGPIDILEPQKRPMSAGFASNVEYYKLGFLDKNSVSLGQQFKEILPLLWLKSGAIGKRPEIDDREPEMLILSENQFAVLIDDTKYAEFIERLAKNEKIATVYFVTNSEEAFREMATGVKGGKTYQLYRDYIDNFVLGSRRES